MSAGECKCGACGSPTWAEPATVPLLTPEQAAIVSAYTGYLIGEFSAMHEYVERVMGRPVWTHEMGTEEFSQARRAASRADFLALNPEDARTGGAR